MRIPPSGGFAGFRREVGAAFAASFVGPAPPGIDAGALAAAGADVSGSGDAARSDAVGSGETDMARRILSPLRHGTGKLASPHGDML